MLPTDDPADPTSGRIEIVWAERIALELRPDLADEEELDLRHMEEANLIKCLKSRERASDPLDWNHPTNPYPITAVEFNWREGDAWFRAYGDIEDGNHRLERAKELRLQAVWAVIKEYRFAPPGERPPDRLHV